MFAALSLSTQMPEGVALQYSGAAFLALTLGYCRALCSMTLLLVITQSWNGIGVALWVDALLPVWFMIGLVAITRRMLPANPFVFLLGCGFFGLFLVSAVQVVVGAVPRALLNRVPVLPQFFSEHTTWSLMLASGGALLEGMIITVLVVYYPRAVALFDDRFYLFKRS